MKCPFELPVEKKVQSEENNLYKIKDAQQNMIACGMFGKQADYIVAAINDFWNLGEYRDYVHARIADGKPIMRYSRWLDAIKELAQALKEVEKPK